MVEVVIGSHADHANMGGGQPLIHVHSIRREVFGNEISLWVAGEMKIAAKQVVFAKELKLNTIQVLVLTPEAGDHVMWQATKWIYHKGEYDNYASIDIMGADAYQYEAGTRSQSQVSAPATLPYDGSIWLNFVAIGE
jgi:hypothetical protein